MTNELPIKVVPQKCADCSGWAFHFTIGEHKGILSKDDLIRLIRAGEVELLETDPEWVLFIEEQEKNRG